MEMIYCGVALVLLISLCYYVARNFAELAEFITQGEKLSKQEKNGLKFLKGKKCRNLFMALSLILMAMSGFVFEEWQVRVFYSVCSILLLAGIFMDASVKLLPDVFTISLLWVALIGSALGITAIEPSAAILSAASLYVMFMLIDIIGEAVTKRTVLGGGDIKIMAAFGALFGLTNSFVLLVIACLIMIVFVAILKIRKKEHDKELPFGIGLTLAAMVNIFYPAFQAGIIDTLIL